MYYNFSNFPYDSNSMGIRILKSPMAGNVALIYSVAREFC